MKKNTNELKIYGISYSDNTSGAFALILTEINGSKKLPIVIGGFEAQAIAVALEKKIKTSKTKGSNMTVFLTVNMIFEIFNL